MGDENRRLARWQTLTAATLFAAYVGYYFCRSNLPVAMPLIADELTAQGVSPAAARERLGVVVSAGMLGYAAGKFLSGGLADRLGGRFNVLAGMLGSVACTVLFAAGAGLPVFMAAWVGNRFVQSFGWVGIVKVTSRWFGYAAYGTVMGLISLSFLLGDAASRYVMGLLIDRGLTWRGVFLVAAGVLAGLYALTAWLVKESPDRLGLPEPPANPESVYGSERSEERAEGLKELLGPLVRSPAFWLVCLLSLGLTLLRETFNTWIPSYYVEVLGLSKAAAASRSAWFPLTGGLSVLLMGPLSDLLGRFGRPALLTLGLALVGLLTAVLAATDLRASPPLAVALVTATGFFLIGPYSFLAGAVALDLGGKRGCATASGLIDGIGYIGGALAGLGVARVVNLFGWHGAFASLAAVAWASALLAAWLWVVQQRAHRAALSAAVVGGPAGAPGDHGPR